MILVCSEQMQVLMRIAILVNLKTGFWDQLLIFSFSWKSGHEDGVG